MNWGREGTDRYPHGHSCPVLCHHLPPRGDEVTDVGLALSLCPEVAPSRQELSSAWSCTLCLASSPPASRPSYSACFTAHGPPRNSGSRGACFAPFKDPVRKDLLVQADRRLAGWSACPRASAQAAEALRWGAALGGRGAAWSPRPSERQAPGRVQPEAHLHRRLSRLGSVLSADTVLCWLPLGEGRQGAVQKVRQTTVCWGLRQEPRLGQGEHLWERKECASWGTEVTGFQLLDTGDPVLGE